VPKSPEDREVGAFREALPCNADVAPSILDTGMVAMEKDPSADEVMAASSGDTQPDSRTGRAPETDVNAPAPALATGSELPLETAASPPDPKADASPTPDASAPSLTHEMGPRSKDDAALSLTGPVSMEAEPSIMIMPVLTPPVVVVTTTDAGARTLRAVKATAGSSPPRISSKEILSHFAAEVIAQGGEGVSLDPTTQNFRHRELEFGRICKVISGIVTVMYGFLGPSVVVSFLSPILSLRSHLLACF